MTENPQPNRPSPDFAERTDQLFTTIRNTGLVRATGPYSDSRIAGVCAGIAQRMGWNVRLVRLGFVVLALFGAGTLAYGLGLLLLPDYRGDILAQRALRRDFSWGFAGGVALVLMGFPSREFGLFSFSWSNNKHEFSFSLFPLIVAAAVVTFLLLKRRSSAGSDPTQAVDSPPRTTAPAPGAPMPTTSVADLPASDGPLYATPAPVAPPSVTAPPPVPPTVVAERQGPGARYFFMTAGLTAMVWLVGALVAFTTGLSHPVQVGAGCAAVVAGLGIIGAGVMGRRSGALLPIALITAALSLVTVNMPASSGVGDRTETVSLLHDATISNGVGNVTLDLTQAVPAATGVPVIQIKRGVGNVTVIYPSTLAIDAHVQPGVGDVTGLASSDGRLGQTDGPPQLKIDVSSGVGNVTFQQK